MTDKKVIDKKIIKKIAIIIFWLLFIIICFLNRERITIENIVSYTPKNIPVAIGVMLLLFSLKSISIVIYGGLLYAASGIMFPLPVAIIVNTVGTVLMVSIPFFIGKKAGKETMNKLVEKNPKLEVLRDVSNKNELFISVFVRLIGMLPGDLVSMYLGASGIHYNKYIAGSMIGLFPAIVSFSVMGMSVDDISSPAFIISTAFEIGLMILSIAIYFIWRKKQKQNFGGKNAEKSNQHIGNA
ncbi:MAG: TVP38/TMEM64 family protein [Lachnospiraceae bacterium]|nr:TVP38/TMEM64 family protein [Lachnospiraceae bacterium]